MRLLFRRHRRGDDYERWSDSPEKQSSGPDIVTASHEASAGDNRR